MPRSPALGHCSLSPPSPTPFSLSLCHTDCRLATPLPPAEGFWGRFGGGGGQGEPSLGPRLQPPLGFGLWSLLLLEDFCTKEHLYCEGPPPPTPPPAKQEGWALYFHSK